MMIFSPPVILPPERPALVRAADLKGLPSWQDMRRREEALKLGTFPFPFVPPSVALTYATWNPSNQNATGVTLSNGNLSVARAGSSNGQVWSTLGKSSGKPYIEITIGDISNTVVGLANGSMVGADRYVGQDTNTWGYYIIGSGQKVNNGSFVAYGTSATNGDVIGIAFDADNGKLFFAKNNTWQNSGDPAAGTNAAYTGLTSGPYYFAISVETVSTPNVANFGASAFTYTPPSGFSGLSA